MNDRFSAAPPSSSLDRLIRDIAALPRNWHTAGSVNEHVLRAIVRHCKGGEIRRSVETGCGKTTLLLSHLSRRHTVFAIEGDNRSITASQTSTLLNASAVEFVNGPTQLTLPTYCFDEPLEFALIDGPHGYPFPELEYLCVYPHLAPGGLLVVDDIHIPTIHHLFEVLRQDEMFSLVEVVSTTAFFRRTDAPLFDPHGDGWWLQGYNKARYPVLPLPSRLRRLWWLRVKKPLRSTAKRLLRRT